MAKLLILLLPMILAASVSVADAQAVVRATSPGILELAVPGGAGNSTNTYRIEVFPASADLRVALPVRTTDVPGRADRNGRAQVDLRRVLEGLEAGDYVATVSTIRAGVLSERSAPTAPFAVGSAAPAAVASPAPAAAASEPTAAASAEPLGVASADPSDPTIPMTAEDKKRERFWTRIAIVIGAAAVLAPFLF